MIRNSIVTHSAKFCDTYTAVMSCKIPLKRICQLKYCGFHEQAVSLLYKQNEI